MQTLQADAPLWDEGISSYLEAEFEKRQKPLKACDLQYIATEHAVRVGDLLETLFLLAISGEWHYCDEEGNARKLDEDALDELYLKGRIGPEDMKAFDGVWLPAL